MTNSGDFSHDGSHHIGDNKAETGSGNCIHNDSHHGALHVKTETGNGNGIQDDTNQGACNKAKAETGNGSGIHDDSHHGLHAKDLTKAEANIGDSKTVVRTKADSKAMTDLGDSQQYEHRTAVRTKAETNSGDSEAGTNLGDTH